MAGPGGVIQNKEGSILISYLGPASFCSINQAELMALNVGLHEVCRQNILGILVEGDSFCVIQWATSWALAPWYLVDILEEVQDLSTNLEASFHNIN